jgi:glycosyltransferase involved in cell wall biosynthesis
VELPYTLAQDSTLFLVLGETSPELWFRKLDWIAAHGGMALINVHPDYLRFPGEPANGRTYPVKHFQALLDYAGERYAGQFWQPLPREVAAFVRPLPRPSAPRPGRRIAMITHSAYETDGRVTRYAEALAARGDEVEVFAVRRDPAQPRHEVIAGVAVHRLQSRYTKSLQSRFAYFWPLVRFLFLSSWAVTRRHLQRRYDVVHVHNIPDFLIFAAWLPRLTGAAVILDIHDIVPELYGSKFDAGGHRLTLALLRGIERCSARYASHVIISNDLWREKFAARTGTGHKCSVFINNVDTQTFRPGLRTRYDGRLIVLFPGGLQWHQGLDLALRAFPAVVAALPEAEFHIYGDGNMKPALVALAAELGLGASVRFFAPVRLAEISTVMANADLGVVPKRADSFGNEAYSTKIMEFMSVGVPVVVSRTQIDQYYFNDEVVRFFDSGDIASLTQTMIEVLRNAQLRQAMIARGFEYSRRHSWESRRPHYLQLVDHLAGAPAAPSDAS